MRKEISCYCLLILCRESGLEGVFMSRSEFLEMGGKDVFAMEKRGGRWERFLAAMGGSHPVKQEYLLPMSSDLLTYFLVFLLTLIFSKVF